MIIHFLDVIDAQADGFEQMDGVFDGKITDVLVVNLIEFPLRNRLCPIRQFKNESAVGRENSPDAERKIQWLVGVIENIVRRDQLRL